MYSTTKRHWQSSPGTCIDTGNRRYYHQMVWKWSLFLVHPNLSFHQFYWVPIFTNFGFFYRRLMKKDKLWAAVCQYWILWFHFAIVKEVVKWFFIRLFSFHVHILDLGIGCMERRHCGILVVIMQGLLHRFVVNLLKLQYHSMCKFKFA